MHKHIDRNTDFEVASLDSPYKKSVNYGWGENIKYLFIGIIFGIILIKAEVASWYRIQEMFHFANFHMYGIIGSAVIVGMISVWIIRKFQIRTIRNENVVIAKKDFSKGQIFGGLIFGIGWAFTGCCPGPMFALIGAGYTVIIPMLLSAVAGTWVYGYFRDKLPH
jgi:uncharacterized membrane protein YedE/YeeE